MSTQQLHLNLAVQPVQGQEAVAGRGMNAETDDMANLVVQV